MSFVRREIEAMTPDRLRAWLALAHAPEVGARRIVALLNRFEVPEAVFGHPVFAYEGLGLGAEAIDFLRNPAWSVIDADLTWLAIAGHDCVTWSDPDYPALLREIADPPPLLFVSGDRTVLQRKQVAIVGSRNPSPLGVRTARQFAAALSRVGLVVTSGLALGIDAASHLGALDADGPTVAVFGCGLDRVYPRRHEGLAQVILQRGGALVSEFTIGTPPRPDHFPRRNRIISGLSLGVLVVEAALRSGSLITARQALEQGREVFAIPGSIHDPLARGCNALIREGAKLVESVNDVLEELGALAGFVEGNGKRGGPDPAPGDEDAKRILAHIAYAPTSVDTLVAATGFSADVIVTKLLFLEMEGFVTVTPGGGYCRSKK
jgi:DNA processing protein